jgi:hypothetical protein
MQKPIMLPGWRANPGRRVRRMLAENIAKMGAATVERLFNTAIRKLARQGFYPEHIVGCLDATDLRTTELCTGCVSVTRERHVRVIGRPTVAGRSR